MGFREVLEKISDFEELSPKELRKKIRIPVVVAPNGDLYIVDYHHFLFVCWQIGVDKVKMKVVCDLSNRRLAYVAFWKLMRQRNYFLSFCQFGEGPRHPLYLPQEIRGI